MRTPDNWKNTYVFAENGKDYDSFYLYLKISGECVYLMTYPRRGLVYDFFKDEKSFSELSRWKPNKCHPQKAKKLEASLKYIFKKASECLADYYEDGYDDDYTYDY